MCSSFFFYFNINTDQNELEFDSFSFNEMFGGMLTIRKYSSICNKQFILYQWLLRVGAYQYKYMTTMTVYLATCFNS